MRKLTKLVCLLILLVASAQAEPAKAAIERTLDDFHQAAAQADGPRYFGHFTQDAVFLGTDLSERWSLAEFQAYAQPHFAQGRGWTYRPLTRYVYLSEDGRTAWFDETLKNDKYGITRGSGVLVAEGGRWKLAQYHLTLPVPNELMDDLVKMIESRP